MLTLVHGRSRVAGNSTVPDLGPDDPSPASSAVCPRERDLVAALAVGDEAAFACLVRQYHRPLIRQALAYVASEAVAEEVVQETWLAVMDGIKRFEGRSSLKTWLYQILIHKAKSAGVRESRQVPLSSLGPPEDDAEDRGFDARVGDGDEAQDGSAPWMRSSTEEPTPEEAMVAEECRLEIKRAIQELPPTQRAALEMYHFEEASSEEVCRRLNVTDTNKHVLLHRGRTQVKKAVDRYFAGERRRAATVRHVYQLGLAA